MAKDLLTLAASNQTLAAADMLKVMKTGSSCLGDPDPERQLWVSRQWRGTNETVRKFRKQQAEYKKRYADS